MIQIASKLLTALKEALHNDVSSTVWSDIDKLRKLVDNAQRDPFVRASYIGDSHIA
jgi:hypothetical protein